MASITIGETEYAVLKPDDLERQLRASSGIGIDETRVLLSGHPFASMVARALIPFLEDPPSMPDLANAIAGSEEILDQVRALYALPKPKKVKPDAGK